MASTAPTTDKKQRVKNNVARNSKSLPLVWEPGPDCHHPGRLCMVANLATCKHALTPFVREGSAHSLTRCGRELPRELSAAEIATQLGYTESHINYLLRGALAKLRKRAAAWR